MRGNIPPLFCVTTILDAPPYEPEFPDGHINPVEFDEIVQEVMEEEYFGARVIGVLRQRRANL